jgi:transcriptional regulator GlxA family with amidase domain
MTPRNVAILVFDGVEVLDFAGPYEVFNVTAELNQPAPFRVFTVAESGSPVRTRGSLSINPDFTFSTMPQAHILVIPGGYGTRALLHRPWVMEWLRKQSTWLEHLVSVCTGALVLAEAGLLAGLEATTHHDNLDDLRKRLPPGATVRDDVRWVDNGRVLLAGGVSAGIDLSLHLVQRLLGDDVLARTLTEMEYAWSPDRTLTWPAAIRAITGAEEPETVLPPCGS